MLAKTIEFKPRPTRANRAGYNDFSAIERRFARIALELTTRWYHNDIDTYLNSLLLDDRGDRQGFPSDVLEELMFLSSLRWQLQHPGNARPDQALVEEFTFEPASQLDTRYCGQVHAWVL
jgi:hypothetical protein